MKISDLKKLGIDIDDEPRSKYGNKKIVEDGKEFDSQGEHRRWCELVLMEKSKLISDLVFKPVFTLRAFDAEIAKMIPDYEYVENDQWIVEDFKSDATITPVFKIKLRLFHANFPSAQFRITGANKKWPSVRRKKSIR